MSENSTGWHSINCLFLNYINFLHKLLRCYVLKPTIEIPAMIPMATMLLKRLTRMTKNQTVIMLQNSAMMEMMEVMMTTTMMMKNPKMTNTHENKKKKVIMTSLRT